MIAFLTWPIASNIIAARAAPVEQPISLDDRATDSGPGFPTCPKQGRRAGRAIEGLDDGDDDEEDTEARAGAGGGRKIAESC